MEQFHYGLRNDVKDLLLTFPEEPKSLTEAISRAVRCDNRLFERRSECQLQIPRSRLEPTYASVTAMYLKPIFRPRWRLTPCVDTARYRKKKSNDDVQIDYVFIAVDQGISQSTVPIGQEDR